VRAEILTAKHTKNAKSLLGRQGKHLGVLGGFLVLDAVVLHLARSATARKH
jgi:hypothetical protein